MGLSAKLPGTLAGGRGAGAGALTAAGAATAAGEPDRCAWGAAAHPSKAAAARASAQRARRRGSTAAAWEERGIGAFNTASSQSGRSLRTCE
ncbi:hypothetical protein CATMQ487_05530 [Sphaerotilus microaerophilus]|uniref:Uncharacterized protein n=1 Tax=Sphaerotilus microaerophilus TaxID=2914710 RepID=A0ABM7YHC8_9BURK|nr:hypothetical protein CATMQ487_05530 [Sphaerotilus sp. FB-5]